MGPLVGLGFLVVLLAEFKRASAAAQRYQDLRYRSACHGYARLADIPARIFEEFYSSGLTAERRLQAPAMRMPAQIRRDGDVCRP
jgi:hypothetical protein